ncbi:MAG: Sec-independent protein translocase protein TatB [Acidobacteriota bacterium]|jgi:Tat protein translocase TatB subunit|nr:Sec-independent protein translocase protein TatB [Acidobacteriota bacterium]
MFYLFIFESIGTSELMLIGLVALIVFGPRKLPEFARTIGKTINEFRRSTDDFKRTWQQEIDLEGAKKDISSLTDLQTEDSIKTERTIGGSLSTVMIEKNNQPEIKEIDKNTFDEKSVKEEKAEIPEITKPNSEKRDWL